eukprot:2515810-Rhodomonas_salina.5
MPGTDIPHGATCLRTPYAKSGTDIQYGATSCPRRFAHPRSPPLLAYAPATRCSAISVVARGPTKVGPNVLHAVSMVWLVLTYPILLWPYALLRDARCRARLCCYQRHCAVLMVDEEADTNVSPAICLCAGYAMSGTDIAFAATRLRACYAMSSTEIAIWSACCCAACSPELAYGGLQRDSDWTRVTVNAAGVIQVFLAYP